MVGPPISGPPPRSASSMTSGALRTLTFISCESQRSATTNISSYLTAFSAFCPHRAHISHSLLAPEARRSSRSDLGRFSCGDSSRSVVSNRRQIRRRNRSRAPLAGMAAAAAGEERRVLITFDVDGTLLRSMGENANMLHKKSFAYAMKDVCGIDGNIDVIKHHGSTDPMVLVKTLEYYGVPTETAFAKLPELKSKTLQYAKENSGQVGEGLELLPGVVSLLEILSKRKDVVVALVTGNLEDIGWLKIDALGIRPFFSTPNFGGFGSDNVERGELVKIAAARAKAFLPGEFSQRVHVGDTPNDIIAAEYGGALAIGVCTGVFSRDELEAASKSGRAVILDDLKDSAIFLKACGLD